MFLPNVVYKKEGEKGEGVLDIYSRLLQIGVIFLTSEINDATSNVFIAQLMYINYDLMLKEVTIYINSPGGCVSSSMAMINTMNNTSLKIRTVCCGMAASAASIILANGTPDNRIALKYSTIMIHQPIGGTRGQATDIDIYSTEIKRIRQIIAQIYHDNSCNKTSVEDFIKYMERDNYLDPKKALDLGLVDKII